MALTDFQRKHPHRSISDRNYQSYLERSFAEGRIEEMEEWWSLGVFQATLATPLPEQPQHHHSDKAASLMDALVNLTSHILTVPDLNAEVRERLMVWWDRGWSLWQAHRHHAPEAWQPSIRVRESRWLAQVLTTPDFAQRLVADGVDPMHSANPQATSQLSDRAIPWAQMLTVLTGSGHRHRSIPPQDRPLAWQLLEDWYRPGTLDANSRSQVLLLLTRTAQYGRIEGAEYEQLVQWRDRLIQEGPGASLGERTAAWQQALDAMTPQSDAIRAWTRALFALPLPLTLTQDPPPAWALHTACLKHPERAFIWNQLTQAGVYPWYVQRESGPKGGLGHQQARTVLQDSSAGDLFDTDTLDVLVALAQQGPVPSQEWVEFNLRRWTEKPHDVDVKRQWSAWKPWVALDAAEHGRTVAQHLARINFTPEQARAFLEAAIAEGVGHRLLQCFEVASRTQYSPMGQALPADPNVVAPLQVQGMQSGSLWAHLLLNATFTPLMDALLVQADAQGEGDAVRRRVYPVLLVLADRKDAYHEQWGTWQRWAQGQEAQPMLYGNSRKPLTPFEQAIWLSKWNVAQGMLGTGLDALLPEGGQQRAWSALMAGVEEQFSNVSNIAFQPTVDKPFLHVLQGMLEQGCHPTQGLTSWLTSPRRPECTEYLHAFIHAGACVEDALKATLAADDRPSIEWCRAWVSAQELAQTVQHTMDDTQAAPPRRRPRL